MKFAGLIAVICVLSVWAFWPAGPPSEDDSVIAERLPANGDPEIEALRQTRRLEFVASVPLNGDTFHPQGLKIVGQDLYLTAVEGRVTGAGHLFHFQLDAAPVPHSARLVESRAFDSGRVGMMNHAGGMDLDGDFLLIPLAAYNPYGPAEILRVPIRDFLRGGGVVSEVSDHLGAMMIEDKVAYAFNWNAEEAYRIDLTSGRETGKVAGDGWAYQDCKRVGANSALCSATKKSWFKETGEIRLITVDQGKQKVKCLWHLSVPYVEDDGRTGSGVLLSRNPIDFRVIRDPGGRLSSYFYFVPQDGPDSRLMIFRGRD